MASLGDRSGLSFALALHGGAGVISKDIDGGKYYEALQRITKNAFDFATENIENDSVKAIDVAVYVVKLLEEEPLFNAGFGAVFTNEETHELEASVMDGEYKRCGAVMLVKTVKSPVELALGVMNFTPHLCLAADGAQKFASERKYDTCRNDYFSTDHRRKQLEQAKAACSVVNDHDLLNTKTEDNATGTVGCVCMYRGHVAAATSTGGMTNKRTGRIGDSAIIGSGTYANDNTCAVSSTGKGEEFMRHVIAYDISARIEYGHRSLFEACQETVHQKLSPGDGGVIACNASGEIVMAFNSLGMFRGLCDSTGKLEIGIWEDTIRIH